MKTIRLLLVLSFVIASSLLSVEAQNERYADHSVLANGRWVKVRVPETGIYQLTDQMLRQAGFTDPERVKVYGYGGALQPEQLMADYLKLTDDLHEVPQCRMAGRSLFRAIGPVSWASATTTERQRNPYSQYGYYFLNDDGTLPLTLDSAAFAATFYPSPDDYHSLYEVDDYAWYQGGRNLFDHRLYGAGVSRSYSLPASDHSGLLAVVMSYSGYVTATVSVNGSEVGSIVVNEKTVKAPERRNNIDQYSKAAVDVWTFDLRNMLKSSNTITITQVSGANMRLDYISLTTTDPRPMPALSSGPFSEPEVVGAIDNQDLHADPQADMVIILPASRKAQSEAERLARLHEQQDGLSVNIVSADQLYNEFSSGTPDANAYRRYMKMLYDRASSDSEKPRYLLLLGDAAWDNRMLLSDWSLQSTDDYLLCYESENSYSSTECYVTDDYFTLLDDDEGADIVKKDMGDLAVGRLTPHDAAEAHVLVDKIYNYVLNEEPGDWQNTICLMGDDGNKNMHMEAADTIANFLARNYPDFCVKKIYWDAYMRTESSRGYAYPDVERLIRQQLQEGALVMNYTGHGGSANLSHEYVASINDFAEATSMRLPLWFTASCDIMPFDTQGANIGETAMSNRMGGAIAFYGTTRTVYADYNKVMNNAFMNHLFAETDGQLNTIGEAVRHAKNELMATGKDMKKNCLHFNLLGDPALRLAVPRLQATIDRVNGMPATEGNGLTLPSGTTVTVEGHIEGRSSFSGQAAITLCDALQHIVCHVNNTDKDDKPKAPFEYDDRTGVIFHGITPVTFGHFSLTFAVPKDVSYADTPGLFYTYAVNDDHTLTAHGHNEAFTIVSADSYVQDGQGPSIRAWLDSQPLTDGLHVGSSPYFYAELSDADGINVSGQGIGHDMELSIDGQLSRTYSLNSSFLYDIGNYRSGNVGFYLPALEDGVHRLFFRAWDVLNNSSSVEYTIYVNVSPQIAGIEDVSAQSPQPVQDLYNTSGRRIGTSSAAPSGLYIRRTQQGDFRKVIITH